MIFMDTGPKYVIADYLLSTSQTPSKNRRQTDLLQTDLLRPAYWLHLSAKMVWDLRKLVRIYVLRRILFVCHDVISASPIYNTELNILVVLRSTNYTASLKR